MNFITTHTEQDPWRSDYAPALTSPTTRINRRRRLVFLVVFALACVLSLSFTFLRPAEYRAEARVQITPAAAAPPTVFMAAGQAPVPAAASQIFESARPFLTEVQVLTSRPVLQQAVERLRPSYDLSSLGADPVDGLQSALLITPVADTNVVELAATGGHAQLLAPLLNTVIGVFQEHLEAAYRNATGQALAAARDEAAKLAANVAAKQREVELFRIQHNIVSPEREENQVLARTTGLSTSLNKANENVDIAEGKLRSLRDAAAAGKGVVRSKDDPTLADLEKRASQLREDLAEQGRSFTAGFMSQDPVIRAKRTKLDNLEQQIKTQRVIGQQAALAEAGAEVASARETVNRIRRQSAEDRSTVQQFTAYFSAFKALQDDLNGMQTLYRAAVQRQLRLEASELDRKPAVQVIEAATTPLEAWRPLYARDAAISVAGSFALGLLAMWFVELFNRPEPQPAFILAQSLSPAGRLHEAADALTLQGPANRALPAAGATLLGSQPALPRELGQDEVNALLRAGSETARVTMLLLLSGISAEEALAVKSDDVDLPRRVIRIGGESAREAAMCEALVELIIGRAKQPGQQLLADAQGRDIGLPDLSAELLCAAHDAGIEQPAEVNPAALRHTYVAFLVRQGIRFADLTQIVGRLPAETLSDYSTLSPAGARITLEAVERVLPALRAPA
ncbi:MAG: hypothetical protein Q8K12_12275 [Thiobacillus sp.]|nr:hypothetical protein [Thiobacillus sp.]